MSGKTFRFEAALLVSLFGHALLLLHADALPRLQGTGPAAARPLTLVSLAQGSDVPKAAEKPVPVAVLRPDSQQARAAPTTGRRTSVASPEVPVVSVATPATGEGREVTGASPVEVSEAESPVFAENLRTYRFALGRAAGRLKQEYDRRYGEFERNSAAGRQGRVDLLLHVRSGIPPHVQLDKSSGDHLLDVQALDLAERAALLAQLPAGLRGRSFSVPLRIDFKLDDE